MTDKIVFYDELKTPLGSLTLTVTMDDLIRIDFGTFSENELKIKQYLSKARLPSHFQKKTINHQIKDELVAYFNHTLTTFTIPTILYGTDFQKDVWQALINIPYGKTVTYKDIAVMVSRPRAVRAVGGALNKNPFSIVFPCHRVIGSDGSLTGFGGGINRKEQLIMFEQKI